MFTECGYHTWLHVFSSQPVTQDPLEYDPPHLFSHTIAYILLNSRKYAPLPSHTLLYPVFIQTHPVFLPRRPFFIFLMIEAVSIPQGTFPEASSPRSLLSFALLPSKWHLPYLAVYESSSVVCFPPSTGKMLAPPYNT